MILLTVIAVGLLSLSAISLRSSTAGEAMARANANARMAILMALGDLQKYAGDDRRITADASISGTPAQPNLVGVWDSWSPDLAAKPTQAVAKYSDTKTAKFRTWLASAPEPTALADAKWADNALTGDPVNLFTVAKDGFEISAARVATPSGAFAWGVSQEATKAKINVAGPDANQILANADLHAQSRPSLALAANFKEPTGDWDLRASRLISMGQVALDKDLLPATAPGTAVAPGASFTAHAQGLLTDVVKAGLKVDLNLGFELSDAQFAQKTWDGTPNPFRSPNSSANFAAPSSFQSQQPLFRPLVENPIIAVTTDFAPASVANRYYAASVPTFDHLRSFYRIPHHLYGDSAEPVVAERGADHIAVKLATAAPPNTTFSPGNPPQGKSSALSIRPVLNRMIYLLGYTLGSDNKVRLIITPIVSLWNPYNTDLEIDGAVTYPWIDVPFQILFDINGSRKEVSMSRLMGTQFMRAETGNHGRSVDPYFFCEISSDGDASNSNNKPIRFKPGEVRVFVPGSTVPVEFNRLGSNYSRTVPLRPVNSVSEMNRKGGLSIPMHTNPGIAGFDQAIKQGDVVKCGMLALNSQYNYFVSLEDGGRVANRANTAHGEAVTEVQVVGFVSNVTEMMSAGRSFNELKSNSTNFPFGVLETYHRVARSALAGQAVSDLLYSTNPRQMNVNSQVGYGSFPAAPQYESTLRSVGSFDDAIQTSSDGRNSFWGPSQSASGKAFLPFFEIPREPLISLAGFQHADLSSSMFSSANQFANSWASPYLARSRAAMMTTKSTSGGSFQLPVYDQPYLTNEALWDGYFFSSAAPRLQPASTGKPTTAWQSPIAQETKSLDAVLKDFVADSVKNPLPDSRMRLVRDTNDNAALVKRLTDPAGCTRIAANLMVDGAFNVNSTDVEAWTALLAGGRGRPFTVDGGTNGPASLTAFPRFRHPTGAMDDNWNGFRALTDDQIRLLAQKCVDQVKLRGPFLSLAEFVNRRIENSALGLSGAIQTAINDARFNLAARQTSFNTSYYPPEARSNLVVDTGVGIPGYLTQADVLQSLAPVLTARSDTFTIRGYGEARDKAGKITARAWCEAVVQRTIAFVDPANPPETKLTATNIVNQTFGRRFEIVSFRQVPAAELQ